MRTELPVQGTEEIVRPPAGKPEVLEAGGYKSDRNKEKIQTVAPGAPGEVKRRRRVFSSRIVIVSDRVRKSDEVLPRCPSPPPPPPPPPLLLLFATCFRAH
ncbi:uncharacterized [Tachysurus ichikawai]